MVTNLKTTRVQSEPHLKPGALQQKADRSAGTYPAGQKQDTTGPGPVPECLLDSICPEVNDFQQVITGTAQELSSLRV